MGLIRPPWISKKWFAQTPFNYCDHFGDKEILATVCIVCKDDIQRLKLYKKAGKDPYDMKNVFEDIADNLGRTMRMVQEKAREMGIDLDNLEDPPEPPKPNTYNIFNVISKYGKAISILITLLQISDVNESLKEFTLDSLAHSRYYMIAKTGRALSSRFYEKDNPEDDTFDSKTSAFLAYIAIERNSRALLNFAQYEKDKKIKLRVLRLAKLSIKMLDEIKQEFFPEDSLDYEEFGCDSYNNLFVVK